MTDLSQRLAACHASPVHDVMREMGYGNCVLPPEIQPLDRSMKIAGEIYTLSGHIDQTLTRHDSLLRWSQVLSRVPHGKVLVCQPNTHAIALMGELSARALMMKDCRGYLMDGHCRDVSDILEMGFPVFGRLSTAADIMERWAYDAMGAPVTIGNVTIRSGDFLIADKEGAVVIPQEIAEQTITETEKVMAEESDMRNAILGGMDPEQAYLKFNRF
jgi:regulator of RNase E activity RraA